MDPTQLADGEVVDRQFRLMRRLGQGGMGEVFLAEQLRMNRPVVVKVMHPYLQLRDASFRGRFQQEAEVVARLNHPNIVQIYACGETDAGTPYLAMEYVEGRNLKEELAARGAFDEASAVAIAAQIGSALHEAHQAGVIHRDLKPENIMLARRHGRDDYVKVLDFGIAKLVESEGKQLTQTGVMFGTPQYMAPEQARCEEVDARTDVYALGLLLYEMLTGEQLFSGSSAFTIALRQVTEPAPPLRARRPAATPALELVIARCLEKSPAARFPSAEALCEALRALQATPAVEPTNATRPVAVDPPAPQQRVVWRIGSDAKVEVTSEPVEDEPSEPDERSEPSPRLPAWGRVVLGDLYGGIKWFAFLAFQVLFMGSIFLFAFRPERMRPIVDRILSRVEAWVGIEPPPPGPTP